MDLTNGAAIVTGGGTGVGRATSLALARLGCSVLVNYSRSAEAAEETAAEVASLGVKSLAFQADVGNDAACREMVAAAEKTFGRVDALVNNAGTTSFIPHAELEKVGDDDWEKILRVNVIAPFQCARAVKPAMDRAGAGAIVNVSSVAGINGTGSSIPYCASKAALNNLTITLARTLAPTIRVNAVAPGFITGRWLQGGLGDAYEPVKQAIEGRVPLGKVCDPSDVADVVVSLIAGADLVTGVVVPIEGGMLLGGA